MFIYVQWYSESPLLIKHAWFDLVPCIGFFLVFLLCDSQPYIHRCALQNIAWTRERCSSFRSTVRFGRVQCWSSPLPRHQSGNAFTDVQQSVEEFTAPKLRLKCIAFNSIGLLSLHWCRATRILQPHDSPKVLPPVTRTFMLLVPAVSALVSCYINSSTQWFTKVLPAVLRAFVLMLDYAA